MPLAEALSLAHHCLLGPDHVRLRRDLAVELIKASFRTERRTDLLMACCGRRSTRTQRATRTPGACSASWAASLGIAPIWRSDSWSARWT